MALLTPVVACFVAAALAPLVARRAAGRRWLGAASSCLAAALAACFAAQLPSVVAGHTPELVVPWVPRLDVALALRLDGLGLLFALLVTGIGAAILAYAGAYLRGHERIGSFFCYLLAFMGSMLGVVLADDLVTFYVFYELTTVTSWLLIAFEHEQPAARRAAKQAFLVTTAGGLCLLVALLLLQHTTGTLRLSQLAAEADAVRSGPYLLMLLLVVAAAFTKSAQVPFHAWLPNAMAAPTPVSAYLHSAAMVKVGLFLLARLSPALAGTTAWSALLMVVGGATALAGAWLSLTQTDLKRLLAYATVSALGVLTVLLGNGGEAGVRAFLTYAVAHALYKSCLFMSVGALDHAVGSRDLLALRGLARSTPLLAGVAVLGAWSFAGAPPSLGFVGKELLYEASRESPLALGVVVLASVGLAAAAGLIALRPLVGRPQPVSAPEARPAVHAPAGALWLAPAACAVAGVGLGVAPGLLDPLLTSAAATILAQPTAVHLDAWHGPGLPLALSVLTLATGAIVYAGWERLRDGRPLRMLERALGAGPDRAYDAGTAGLFRLARWQTWRLRTGDVRASVAAILTAAIVVEGAALLHVRGVTVLPRAAIPARDGLILCLLLVAAAVACRAPVRFRTIISLSVAGYAAALFYVAYGAPDLALVQVLVETLIVVLFVLALGGVPTAAAAVRSRFERVRDVALALGAGAVVTSAMLGVLTVPFDPRLGRWYGEHAHDLGHGRNVVNVILVDFRAFDTLGEVIVVVVASAGVWTLIGREAAPGARSAAPGAGRTLTE